MVERIDPRGLAPLELLVERVIDLPLIELRAGDEVLRLDAVDVVELAAGAAAFDVFAENLATGRITRFEPAQLASCNYHLHAADSLAIFGGTFEPFGGVWEPLPLAACEDLVARWRDMNGLPQQSSKATSRCGCWRHAGEDREAGTDDDVRGDGLVRLPLFGLRVDRSELATSEQSIRREHAALVRGEYYEHLVPDRPTEFPPLMDTEQLARYLGVSEQTPRRWRSSGGGPPWIKLSEGRGGRVVYRKEAVDRWLLEHEGS